MIVVDASVAVKWLVVEDGTEPANELLSAGSPLFVPSHARIEVVAAVVRKHREGTLSDAEVRRSLDIWDGLLRDDVVKVIGFEELLEKAVAISMANKHPLADCLYIAAAVRLGASLITADAKLHERGQRACRDVALLAGFYRN